MNELSVLEASVRPCLTLDLKFNINYGNIFDLGTSLLDLQSLISGITRVFNDNQSNYEEYKFVASKSETSSNSVANNSLERIDELIDDIFTDVSEIEKKRFRKELENEFFNPEIKYIEKYYESEVRPYPTSRRDFNKKFKNLIKLNRFEQGSLLLSITSTVLAGIILKFIERVAFGNETGINVNVSNNIIVINQENDIRKLVKITDLSSRNASLKKSDIYIDKYLDNIIDKVNINKNDIEDSVGSLLNVLSEEGYFKNNIIYDKKGIKTITNDIERFRGNFIDICT